MSARSSLEVDSQRQSHSRRWLLLICGIYLLLALGFGAVNPLFEAPDEQHHYFTAQFIADNNRLPSTTGDANDLTGQEAAQPPLYYMLSAQVIKLLDPPGAEDEIWPNPFVKLGVADSPDNTNAFIHSDNEAWPWQGFTLAAHLLRAFSALLGLGTVLCIYGSGLLIWPENPERALLASALVAFLPQFVFVHSTISNDTLIIVLCAVTFYQLLGLWYGQLSWRRYLLLGATIGLAILSKVAGLLLLVYVTGFIIVLHWPDPDNEKPNLYLKDLVLHLAIVTLPALLISGWSLWRNWQLYGDLTATNQFIRLAGGDRGYTLGQVLSEWPGLWRSLIAVFGWFNIDAPGWVFVVWNGVVLAAILGVLLEFIRYLNSRKRKGVFDAKTGPDKQISASWREWPGLLPLLLAIWPLMVYAGVVAFAMRTPASQGRLLFPAIVPLALGLAYGLSRYRWQAIQIATPVLVLITSVFSLLVVIPSAYALPPLIASSYIPSEALLVNSTMGFDLELVAYEIESLTLEPGDQIWLTLYWRANSEISSSRAIDSPKYVVEVFGHEDSLVGKLQSYHGGGLYPASLWTPGDIVVDRIPVQLDEDLLAPVQARLILKLVGREESAFVGEVKVKPDNWPEASDQVMAVIEGLEIADASLDVHTASPGDFVPVRVRWQVNNPPDLDLTTLIHLGDPTQQPIAQGDSPPLGGHYPTSVWESGEVIDDLYELFLPPEVSPGRYPIYVGMYEPLSGTRRPLLVEGIRQPSDTLLVGWIEVE